MIFRSALPSDATAVAALHAANWKDVYRDILKPAFLDGQVDLQQREIWHERLNNPARNQLVLLALEGDALLGFICCYRNRDPVWGTFIDNLHVAKSHRGNGLGSALLQEVAAWERSYSSTPSLYLWVFEANERARNYYGRRGGRAVEVIDDTTPDGGSARSVRIHWPDGVILPATNEGR